MSYTKTSMSNEPILVADNWSNQELLKAGWTDADLEWERSTAEIFGCLTDSQPADVSKLTGQVLFLARSEFSSGDPRLATSLANHAFCLAIEGDAGIAETVISEARNEWKRAGLWIESMKATRVARSSMFHLRMELRHRDTYEQNWRTRWRQMADQAVERVNRPIDAVNLDCNAATEALVQWQRARPAMLNDTRKLMAATMLLLPGV